MCTVSILSIWIMQKSTKQTLLKENLKIKNLTTRNFIQQRHVQNTSLITYLVNKSVSKYMECLTLIKKKLYNQSQLIGKKVIKKRFKMIQPKNLLVLHLKMKNCKIHNQKRAERMVIHFQMIKKKNPSNLNQILSKEGHNFRKENKYVQKCNNWIKFLMKVLQREKKRKGRKIAQSSEILKQLFKS